MFYLAYKIFSLAQKVFIFVIKTDSTTAVSYINNLGGVKSIPCHEITRELWLWCLGRKLHLSAEELLGVLIIL